MRRFAILITSAVTVVSCAPEDHGADSIHNKCVYASYNPKALDQFVAVCMKCDRGSRTCSTSCTLKGAL
jgi:hypothetical protein